MDLISKAAISLRLHKHGSTLTSCYIKPLIELLHFVVCIQSHSKIVPNPNTFCSQVRGNWTHFFFCILLEPHWDQWSGPAITEAFAQRATESSSRRETGVRWRASSVAPEWLPDWLRRALLTPCCDMMTPFPLPEAHVLSACQGKWPWGIRVLDQNH